MIIILDDEIEENVKERLSKEKIDKIREVEQIKQKLRFIEKKIEEKCIRKLTIILIILTCN